MFAYIRKHAKWLLGVIVVVIFISFVIYFIPNFDALEFLMSRTSGKGQAAGRAVTADFSAARGEMQVHYLLQNVDPSRVQSMKLDVDGDGKNDGENDIDSLTFETQVRLRELDEVARLGIQVGKTSVEAWLERHLRFQSDPQIQMFYLRALTDQRAQFSIPTFPLMPPGMNSQFSSEIYQKFLNETLSRNGVNEEDLRRYVRHQIAINQMYNVLAASGSLTTRRVAHGLYQAMNEEFETEVVFLTTTNFTDSVTNFAAVTNHYNTTLTNNYKIPAKVTLQFVRMANTNFHNLAAKDMTNLATRVDNTYKQRGADAFKDDNGTVLPEADAKARVRAEILTAPSRNLANKCWSDLARLAFGQNEKAPTSRLGPALNGLTNTPPLKIETAVLEEGKAEQGPFKEFPHFGSVSDQNALRNAFNRRTELIQQLFDMDRSGLLTSPYISGEATYLIGRTGFTPARGRAYGDLTPEEQKEVREDFIETEASRLTHKTGQALREKLVKGLDQGGSFTNICQTDGWVSVALPSFSSQRTEPLEELAGKASLTELQQAVENHLATVRGFGSGQKATPITTYVETSRGGFILHLKKRVPVAEEKLQRELPFRVHSQVMQGRNNARRQWAGVLRDEVIQALRQASSKQPAGQ